MAWEAVPIASLVNIARIAGPLLVLCAVRANTRRLERRPARTVIRESTHTLLVRRFALIVWRGSILALLLVSLLAQTVNMESLTTTREVPLAHTARMGSLPTMLDLLPVKNVLLDCTAA